MIGSHAELFTDNPHKSWTATRLAAGVVTGGQSMLLAGRRNKGTAVVHITFGNGSVQSFNVKPENVGRASMYVHAFNALASSL